MGGVIAYLGLPPEATNSRRFAASRTLVLARNQQNRPRQNNWQTRKIPGSGSDPAGKAPNPARGLVKRTTSRGYYKLPCV